MSKSILDYVPEKIEQRKPVTVKLKESFYREVDKQRQKDELTWYDLSVALYSKYLEERKKK